MGKLQFFTVRDERGEEFGVTVNAPPRKAWEQVRELCRTNGWILLCQEDKGVQPMPKPTETHRAYIRYANGVTEAFRTSMSEKELLRYAKAKASYDRTAVKTVRLNNAPAFGGSFVSK